MAISFKGAHFPKSVQFSVVFQQRLIVLATAFRINTLLLPHCPNIMLFSASHYRRWFTTDAVLIGTRDVACYHVSSSFCFPPLPARCGDTRTTRQGAALLTC